MENATRAAAQSADVVALSVEQYHRMRESGILDEDEPVELLHGLLVHKDRGGPMPVSPRHALVTSRMVALAPALEKLGCHLRVQNPITLPPSHEPEPDGAIVRGRPEDYLDAHPQPPDVFCVVEVSDSSLSGDRTIKQGVYAGAEIPQYVIVNIAEGRVEVYERPDAVAGIYKVVRILHKGDSLALHVDGPDVLTVAVDSWLP